MLLTRHTLWLTYKLSYYWRGRHIIEKIRDMTHLMKNRKTYNIMNLNINK